MVHLRDGSDCWNHQQSAEREIAPERNVEDQIRVFVILPLQRDCQVSGHRRIKPNRDEGHIRSHQRSERNQPIHGWTQVPDQKRHVQNPHNHAQPEVSDIGNQVERKPPGLNRANCLDRGCFGTHQKLTLIL